MLEITAIGSCRVANPIRRAVGRFPIKLNNSRVYGYTHSAAEAVQQIRFLKNRFAIPDHLRHLLAPAIDSGVHENAAHRTSGAYFVEISSAKIVRVGDTCVQWNHVCRHFDRFLDDPDRARVFWSLARPDSTSEKVAFLESEPEYARLAIADRQLLQAMTLQIADRDALRADISTILLELPRVIFVTHCNALLPHGQPIPSRNAFTLELTGILTELGAEFSDPTELMAAFGQSRALRDENGSLTHYTDMFERALFADWYGCFLQTNTALALVG